MIFSAEQLFSDNQAVTASALSTNVIDLGVAGTPYGAAAPLNQDQGKGCPVWIRIQVTNTFASLTDITFTIEVADNAAISTNAKVIASETHVLADLVAGRTTYLQYLPNGADQRYLAVRYTVGGSNGTLGTITSGITMGNQTNYTGG